MAAPFAVLVMSTRRPQLRTALLLSVPLAAATGVVRSHGIRFALDVLGLGIESAVWITLVVQVTVFLTGTLAVFGLGYVLGGGPNPHREFLPLGAALLAGGLVGFGAGALLPLLIVSPDAWGQVSSVFGMLVSVMMLAFQFALVGLAGVAAATFLGDRAQGADAGASTRY